MTGFSISGGSFDLTRENFSRTSSAAKFMSVPGSNVMTTRTRPSSEIEMTSRRWLTVATASSIGLATSVSTSVGGIPPRMSTMMEMSPKLKLG